MSEAPRVLVTCPSCGAPLPREAAHAVVTCAACNATSQPSPVVQTVGTPSCPCCRVPLFPARAGDVSMHGCGRCGGLWLDNEGSEAITRHADPRVLRLADRADERAKQQPRPTQEEPLPCPVCRATMQKVSPARIAQLDICPDHGTWFDPGELRRVATVFQNRSNDDVLAPIIDPIEGHRRANAAAAAAAAASAPGSWLDGPAADAAFEGATKLAVGVGVGILSAMLGPTRR